MLHYQHERNRNGHRKGETTGRGPSPPVVDLVAATGTRRGSTATGWKILVGRLGQIAIPPAVPEQQC